jgi:hypothetical protein
MSQGLVTTDCQSLFNAAIHSRRVDLPDDVVGRILDTMRVPDSGREAAATYISRILAVGVILFGCPEEWQQRRASLRELAEVGALARDLKTKLLNLDASAKFLFELGRAAIEIGCEPDADARDRMTADLLPRIIASASVERFERYEREVWNIACAASAATDRLCWPRNNRPPKRLVDCPEIVAFEITVKCLCGAAASNGWHLTLSHNTESGTLIDVIRMVEPYLPPGFVPRVLNADRLRSLRNRGRKYP